MSRPDWPDYYLAIARAVARRASCPRLAVGAVLVKDNAIIATGYNGAPSGFPECEKVGCEMENGHCVRVLHAERNVLLHAARHAGGVHGSTLYLTHEPCYDCAKHIIQAGVKRVVFDGAYRSDRRVAEAFAVATVQLTRSGFRGA